MKLLILNFLVLFSVNAFASMKLECSTDFHKILVEAQLRSGILVTLDGETVLADGLVDESEVDLTAKFKSAGEITLFAKIGKVTPENYLFIQGKRFSVICR